MSNPECQGVLLILDENAVPFTRAWCCFEGAMVVGDAERKGDPLLLDVATARDGRAHVATQGPTAADRKKYDKLADSERQKTSVTEIKVQRERGFPHSVFEKSRTVDIFMSEASVEMDRIRILNAISHKSLMQLDEDPQVSDPAFAAVNAALRGLFAEVSLPAAERYGQLESALEVLAKDTKRTRLQLHFPCAALIALPPLAPMFSAWPQLKKIELDTTGSGELTDVSALQGLAHCLKLRRISL